MPGEPRPARKAVLAGNGELRVSERATAARLLICLCQVAGNPSDGSCNSITELLRCVGAMTFARQRDVQVVEPYERLDPLGHPRTKRVGIAGLADPDKVLSSFLVL